MRIDPNIGEYMLAESMDDFKGWDILNIIDFKPGVKLIYMRKVYPNGSGSFMSIFSKDEICAGLNLGQR